MTNNINIKIASRVSPMALAQSNLVGNALKALHPGLEYEIVGFTTTGDKLLGSRLAKIGGKGLFVKELEQALLDGEADIAVHSMKDVPMQLPEPFALPVMCQRDDVRDAFVSETVESFDALPQGARLGTSSLRRQCQVLRLRPDLEIIPIRGNANTRLRKLKDGEVDALLLATSGLERLGLEDKIRHHLSVEDFLPAIGQGALGIECRNGDTETIDVIAPLNDRATYDCVGCERAIGLALNASCTLPLASLVEIADGRFVARAMVGTEDGKQIVEASEHAALDDATGLAKAVSDALLAQGAGAILEKYNDH
jgi:hydroxymethylbilane synthase